MQRNHPILERVISLANCFSHLYFYILFLAKILIFQKSRYIIILSYFNISGENYMLSILTDLEINLTFTLASIILGTLFSLIISLFFYVKSLKRKWLLYSIKTSQIVSNKINKIKGLEVTYYSQKLKNLYYTEINIKNVGNTIIENHDFLSTCQLSIHTNGEFLFMRFISNHATNLTPVILSNDEKIEFTNNEAPHVKIINNAIINFECIAKNELITCSILHTENISIDGELKEGKLISKHNVIKYFIFFIISLIIIISFYILLGLLGFS